VRGVRRNVATAQATRRWRETEKVESERGRECHQKKVANLFLWPVSACQNF
jgi:hypothetical protein